MSSDAASGTSTLSVLAALKTSAPSIIPSGLAWVCTSITDGVVAVAGRVEVLARRLLEVLDHCSRPTTAAAFCTFAAAALP